MRPMLQTGTPANADSRARKRQKRDSEQQTSVSCQRCRSKKIRCDESEPRCWTCQKADAECIILDTQSGTTLTRSQLHELEDRTAILEDLLAGAGVEVPPTTLPVSTRHKREKLQTVNASSPIIPRFLGEQSGIGFMQYVISSIRKHTRRSAYSKIHHRGSFSAITSCVAHEMPSATKASDMITTYLHTFAVQHPFISSEDVRALHGLYYSNQSDCSTSPVSRMNLLHLNMIFALASIDHQRRGSDTTHPFGYFMAALEHVVGELNFGSIQDIQGLLLIATFGQYYNTGCSLWELGQLCLRMCVEMGLHKRPAAPLSQYHEQNRRRVFWECYKLDRSTAFLTGRPLGLDEADIQIEEPYESLDDYLSPSQDLDFDMPPRYSDASKDCTEMAAFNATLKLTRLGSAIRTAFYSRTLSKERSRNEAFEDWFAADAQVPLNAGDTYHVLDVFDEQLSAWKSSIPRVPQPSSPFASQEWLELLYAQERFHLIRAAIESIHTRQTLPPVALLNRCYHAAANVIEQFSSMSSIAPTVCTWQSLQQILACGLCVVFCCLLDSQTRAQSKVKRRTSTSFQLPAGFHEVTPGRTISDDGAETIVNKCADSLFWIAEHMTDALQFARFFDTVRNQLHRVVEERRSESSRRGPNSGASSADATRRAWSQPVGSEHHDFQAAGLAPATTLADSAHFASEQFAFLAPSDGTAGSITTDDDFWADNTWNLDTMISQFFERNDTAGLSFMDGMSWQEPIPHNILGLSEQDSNRVYHGSDDVHEQEDM